VLCGKLLDRLDCSGSSFLETHTIDLSVKNLRHSFEVGGDTFLCRSTVRESKREGLYG